MTSPKKPSDWQEALKMMSRCPICNGEYNQNQAKLFLKHEGAHVVHVTCSMCESYFVAMIMMVGQGLSSVGMVTDLSYDDVVRLYNKETLTVDEIIEGYETIHNKHFLQNLLTQ